MGNAVEHQVGEKASCRGGGLRTATAAKRNFSAKHKPFSLKSGESRVVRMANSKEQLHFVLTRDTTHRARMNGLGADPARRNVATRLEHDLLVLVETYHAPARVVQQAAPAEYCASDAAGGAITAGRKHRM